ncbi:hypothetical protein Bbelb_048560 [Branchiostoma belcheri]|nr:hypothetical protein Bbelb_048560 [Branchiostoma belcheri]
MTVLTMLLLERTQDTIPSFDKDDETTIKFATPAAKTFLARKVPQLVWDFAERVHIYISVTTTSLRFTLDKLENNEETIWDTKRPAIAAPTSHHRPSSPTEAGTVGARRFRQDDVDDLEKLTWEKECPGKKFNQMDEFLHHACEPDGRVPPPCL